MDKEHAVAILATRCENDAELTDAVCLLIDRMTTRYGVAAAGALVFFETVKELVS